MQIRAELIAIRYIWWCTIGYNNAWIIAIYKASIDDAT